VSAFALRQPDGGSLQNQSAGICLLLHLYSHPRRLALLGRELVYNVYQSGLRGGLDTPGTVLRMALLREKDELIQIPGVRFGKQGPRSCLILHLPSRLIVLCFL
jgi:hypothetical protein